MSETAVTDDLTLALKTIPRLADALIEVLDAVEQLDEARDRALDVLAPILAEWKEPSKPEKALGTLVVDEFGRSEWKPWKQGGESK